ncbi:MAG: hypothetical protein ACFE75_12460 [Candidatus Hodarchaeota archaeon]
MKLIYDLDTQTGTLYLTEIKDRYPFCNLKNNCEEFETVEQLSVYYFEGYLILILM